MSNPNTRVSMRTEICFNLPSIVKHIAYGAREGRTPIVLTMNGEILHIEDMHQVVESYIQLALLQYDILSHFPRSLQTGPNAYYKYIAKLLSRDVNEVFVQLSNFKDWLQHYTRVQSHLSVRAAKKTLSQRGVKLNHCVFDLIRPIIWVYVKQSLPNLHTPKSTKSDALTFRYLYDFCCLISRLTLNHVDSITDAAIQKYCDQEEAMKNWQYDDYLINELRLIVQERIKDLTLVTTESCYPDLHHSNGATAECRRGVGLEAKYKNIKIPKELYDVFSRRTGLDLLEWPSVKLCKYEELVSKTLFAPKGIDKKRVISPGCTGLIWFQNAIFRALDELFKKHPEYNIDLHDQEKSRRLVTIAALRGTIATIDLSAASDSVTWKLVEQLFIGTEWYSILKFSRAKYTKLPDGRVIELAKAYPMGDPLCFPMQCLVFSSICELACRLMGVNSLYRVYGDDIEVEYKIYKCVVWLLTKLHFTVNTEKSFSPAEFFKESCGMESFFGYDVSPCRISRRFDIVAVESAKGINISPAILGAVELHNRFHKYGYNTLAKHLSSVILEKVPFLPYIQDETKFGLLCSVAKNDHLANLHNNKVKVKFYSSSGRKGHRKKKIRKKDLLRWNSLLQRFEVLTPVFSLKRNSQSQNIRYFETLRTLDRRSAHSMVEQPLNVYVGHTKDMVCKWKYTDDICVRMQEPLRNIPLCPPEYWNSGLES